VSQLWGWLQLLNEQSKLRAEQHRPASSSGLAALLENAETEAGAAAAAAAGGGAAAQQQQQQQQEALLPSGQLGRRPLAPLIRRAIKQYLVLVRGFLLPGQVSNVGINRVG
jgi:hypothetical protein